jgi:hypothetical protein
LDAAGVTAVLRAAQASRYHGALVLIAATGLRKGEALALRWDRVDLEDGTLRIAATIARVDHKLVITEPKTARSKRCQPEGDQRGIGHANVGFFLETYAHVLANDDREAAEQAASFLLGNAWDTDDETSEC